MPTSAATFCPRADWWNLPEQCHDQHVTFCWFLAARHSWFFLRANKTAEQGRIQNFVFWGGGIICKHTILPYFFVHREVHSCRKALREEGGWRVDIVWREAPPLWIRPCSWEPRKRKRAGRLIASPPGSVIPHLSTTASGTEKLDLRK